MEFKRRHLLGIEELDKDEIIFILNQARAFKEVIKRRIKKVPTLRGQTIVNLFYEPSTRTRTSFELAAKWLSADVVNISVGTSSVVKGESLRDTAKTIEAMEASMIVIRHPQPGAPHILAGLLRSSVINAGDGAHEHPTQALLDLFTILEHKETIEGLVVGIVGDIAHSRVARSNILALKKMGARVIVVGPPTLIPLSIERMGVEVSYRLDDVLPKIDILMMLRIQVERQSANLIPSIREYIDLYGVDIRRLGLAKKGVLVMHPGPVNRGIELTSEVVDGPQSLIHEQVTNGVAVRMAILYLLAGGGKG